MTYSTLGTDSDTQQIVELSQASRRQGFYIIGANGTGKTGLIEHLILQDIDQGLGVGLLDPHGDLSNAILAKMTKREDDVILLDIQDEDHPFGFNVFACPNPQSNTAVQKIADLVMHIFEKLYDVSRQTPRMAQFLRNCTHTLVANPGYSMADISLLLQDERCRRKLVANVTDPKVQLFWKTYDALKPSEQFDRAESTLNKMDELLQPLTCNIVGQAQTTVNIQQVMDERKILLVKLSAQLDQVTSLVGTLFIALFLNAAYSRANMPANKRKQFNLYADEFQRFATEDFATLLTEARKFGIATTIAHQARYQPGMTDGIRAVSLQAANLVVFRVSGPDSEEMAKSFDATPPPGAVIGQQAILTPVQDVIGHLVSKGHHNPAVSQFATDYLTKLEALLREVRSDRIVGTEVGYLASEDVAEGARRLNQVLAQCMREKKADWYIPALALLVLTLAADDGSLYVFAHHVKEDFTHNVIGFYESARMFGAPAFLADPQRVQAFIVKHCTQRVADSLFRGHTVYPGQAFVKLLFSLRQTMAIVAREPILVATGQHSPIYDKPRTYQDVQNETASKLATLPNFTALTRIATEHSTSEYTIRTFAPERGLGKAALQERIERIQAHNRQQGYTRSRQDVEAEIRQRQAQCSQLPPLPGQQPHKPPEEEPPISRQQPL